MRNWLIYEPPGGARPTLDDAEKFVTIREGFSKRGFLFAPFWLAVRRCWVALAVYVVVELSIGLVAGAAGLGGGAALVLVLLPNFAVGFEAAWLRARALERRGFTHAGSVYARSREEAEALFFQDWLAGHGREAPPPPPARDGAPYRRPGSAGVLGFFPEPGATR